MKSIFIIAILLLVFVRVNAVILTSDEVNYVNAQGNTTAVTMINAANSFNGSFAGSGNFDISTNLIPAGATYDVAGRYYILGSDGYNPSSFILQTGGTYLLTFGTNEYLAHNTSVPGIYYAANGPVLFTWPGSYAYGEFYLAIGTAGNPVTATLCYIIHTNNLPGLLPQLSTGLGSNLTNAAGNGFVDYTITNGLASTNFVNTTVQAATNGLTGGGVTLGGVTNVVVAFTNNLATTNYVNTATNGFVRASITNGLATTNYVNTTVQSATNNFMVNSNGFGTNLTLYGHYQYPPALTLKETNTPATLGFFFDAGGAWQITETSPVGALIYYPGWQINTNGTAIFYSSDPSGTNQYGSVILTERTAQLKVGANLLGLTITNSGNATFNSNVTVLGTNSATYYIGNGGGLTNIPTGNITNLLGTVTNVVVGMTNGLATTNYVIAATNNLGNSVAVAMTNAANQITGNFIGTFGALVSSSSVTVNTNTIYTYGPGLGSGFFFIENNTDCPYTNAFNNSYVCKYGSAYYITNVSGMYKSYYSGTISATNSSGYSSTNWVNSSGGTINFIPNGGSIYPAGTYFPSTTNITTVGNGIGITNIPTSSVSNFLGAVTNVASTYGGISLSQATNVAGSLTNGFITLSGATNVASALTNGLVAVTNIGNAVAVKMTNAANSFTGNGGGLTNLTSVIQQGSTNAVALTAFTATFSKAFADTNYTAVAIGNGFALASSYVSTKTVSSCVFNMTIATGTIDWMAVHQ